MEWYYALNGNQMGPVAEADLVKLRASGTIDASTLVWRNGMADWRPLGEVGLSGAPAPGVPVAAGAGGILCSECGRAFGADDVVKISDRLVCAACKPIVLQKLREGVVGSEVEKIRNEHLKHEASVQSMGFLFILQSVFAILGGGLVLIGSIAGGKEGAGVLGMGVFMLLIGAAELFVGLGLRKLKRSVRIGAGLISGLGLCAFPIGTIIAAYFLYLLFSQKGTMVFSDEYQRVVEQTPHIKYRTSIIVWIVLALIVGLMMFGIIAAMLAPRH